MCIATAVGRVQADQHAETRILSTVTLFGNTVLGVDIQTLEIVLQHEIDHASHGVRAVHGRCATGDHFDRLDGGCRNGVDVDDQRGIGRLRATAVNQHQVAIGAEAAQVEGRGARAGGRAALDAGTELRAVAPGTNCGILLRVVSSVVDAVFLKASSLTVAMGLAAVRSRRKMREPVTVTSARSASSAPTATGAWTEALPSIAATAAPTDR